MSKGGEHLKDEGSKSQAVAAGAIAGLMTRFVIAPLDVVKIRLQLQTHPQSNVQSPVKNFSPIYNGIWSSLKHIVASEGITGLWKGNVPAELMYISYSAIQFTTYRTISLTLQKTSGEHQIPFIPESFIAGAGAGAVSTTVTYPLDLLRTRFAAQGVEKVYNSLGHAVREIYRSEGPHGFFRGLSAGLGQIVPYMGIFFSTYETLRLPMRTLHLPFGTGDASTGVIASLLAKTCVFPLDLVRKRLQVQGPNRSRYINKNLPVYHSITKAVHSIVKTEGIKGLYRGLTVSLLKAAPTGAMTMWIYERVLHILTKTQAPLQI
ncbi:Mitochondrial thiamine pyrophosphate carrier 1 [Podosphaera aphanis]|nr:Mitochondrial thiamine pyrophosphate carrier 1 [Podosphaera aphanis]